MKAVKVLYAQTVIDIAIQELGDAQRSFEIAKLNGISISDDLVAGGSILVPDFEADKKNLVQLFSDDANKPASADADIEDLIFPSGINFWAIELDFVVQ